MLTGYSCLFWWRMSSTEKTKNTSRGEVCKYACHVALTYYQTLNAVLSNTGSSVNIMSWKLHDDRRKCRWTISTNFFALYQSFYRIVTIDPCKFALQKTCSFNIAHFHHASMIEYTTKTKLCLLVSNCRNNYNNQHRFSLPTQTLFIQTWIYLLRGKGQYQFVPCTKISRLQYLWEWLIGEKHILKMFKQGSTLMGARWNWLPRTLSGSSKSAWISPAGSSSFSSTCIL